MCTMTTQPAPDRRVRRSRRALREALVGLCLEKGYAAVTVDDVAERADVSRATLYAHYADKRALLEDVAEELWAELEARTRVPLDTAMTTFGGEAIAILFRHAHDEVAAYRVVVGDASVTEVARLFERRIAGRLDAVLQRRARDLGSTPRVPSSFLSALMAAEVVTTLSHWLEGRRRWKDAERLALWTVQHLAHGDAWSMGLPPGATTVDEEAFRQVFAAVRA